jgi:hypothetical protein
VRKDSSSKVVAGEVPASRSKVRVGQVVNKAVAIGRISSDRTRDGEVSSTVIREARMSSARTR